MKEPDLDFVVRISTYYFLLLIFLIGCSRERTDEIPEHLNDLENLTIYPANPEPLLDIELVKESSFGETEEMFFGRIIDHIAVDEAERVFIADLLNNTIHVYSPDGSYLRSIGREGRGPGEFLYIQDMKIYNGQIHVLDMQQFKISIIDINDFQPLADYNLMLNEGQNGNPSWMTWTSEMRLSYRPGNIFLRGDGSWLVLFSDQGVGSAHNVEGRTYEVSVFSPADREFIKHDLLSFKWTGQILVHEPAGGGLSVMRNIPYKRSSQFDFSINQLVLGWTEEMLFKFYDQDGEYQRAFYYPYNKIPFELNDVLKSYENAERVLNAIKSDEHPETWPAYHSLILDDENRLWVSTLTNDHEVYEWWVMDEYGKLLAKYIWPRNREAKIVKDGYVYTLETDKETDVKEVVRYRIEMK